MSDFDPTMDDDDWIQTYRADAKVTLASTHRLLDAVNGFIDSSTPEYLRTRAPVLQEMMIHRLSFALAELQVCEALYEAVGMPGRDKRERVNRSVLLLSAIMATTEARDAIVYQQENSDAIH